MTRREWIFLIIFGVTLALWIAAPAVERLTGGRVNLSLQGVGLAAALIIFLPGLDLVSWSDAERSVHWGTLWVLAGGLAAGLMLYRSGAARWLAWTLLGPLGSVAPLPRVFATVGAVLVLRMLFSSSTAAAAILIPLIIVLAQDLGIDPWLCTAPVAFSVNLGFIFPTQAAAHLVSYSAGQFSTHDMVRGGIPLTLVAAWIIGGVVLIVGAATGLYRLG
jgi:sodium-dependent dicarboxylate transporter 2/3/5